MIPTRAAHAVPAEPEFDYMSYNEQIKFSCGKYPIATQTMRMSFITEVEVIVVEFHTGCIQNINCLWRQLMRLPSFHFS